MPFEIDGTWREPTDDDLAKLKQDIEQSIKDKDQIPVLPKEIVKELSRQRTLQFMQRESNVKTYKALESALSRDLGRVDIVLPVYGALRNVKDCVQSVLEHTRWPYNLIIVDDCSPDVQVHAFLTETEKLPNVYTLYNKKNRGFAATVNRGVRCGHGKYICVLNSDVIVTPNWLTKLILALESDPRNQIVNPVTNNTALINVPMQTGFSYLDMNYTLERISHRRYPEIMPTGFCFMFKRELTNLTGLFDEGYISYGEETDFWLKTLNASKEGRFMDYRAILADDTYIFHERGSSFSQLGSNEHMGLRKRGNERFHALHPEYREKEAQFLADAREAVGPLREPLPRDILNDKEYKFNVAWVVQDFGGSGGMRYITDVMNALIEEGVNAKVVCVPQDFQRLSPPPGQLHTMPIVFSNSEAFIREFPSEVFSNGIVIAAVNQLVPLVEELCRRYGHSYKGVHHVQSYDPHLAEYVAPDRVEEMKQVFGKLDTIAGSDYIKNLLKKEHKINAPAIPPGIDLDVFHPRDRAKGDDRPTVMVYMSKNYKFRGYDRGVELCKEIWKLAFNNGKEIRILALGSMSVPECPYVIGLGQVSQSYLAQLFANEVDVFVDPSYVHSYGLMGLEALVSGCDVITWDNGGVNDYKDDYNNLVVAPSNAAPKRVANATIEILNKPIKRESKIKPKHMREYSIKTFTALMKKMAGVDQPKKKITVVTPHLRKHGGPTTLLDTANILKKSGHDVSMVTIFPDFNKELIQKAEVPIFIDWDKPRTDIVLVNSDNPHSDKFIEMPFNKKILIKLSHNPRFKAYEEKSLNLPWDHIITSTEWLRQACLKQKEGWFHQEWPEDKVTRVGWYHYGHDAFNANPTKRSYGEIESGSLKVGILIHAHPLKGSSEAMAICMALKKKYGRKVHIYGIGEAKAKVPDWFTYYKNMTRRQITQIMKHLDIWISASHTEGLGRMSLEAMSAGCAVVATDTGAEHLRHNENCLMFPVGDAQAGGEAVDVLINDKEMFKNIVFGGYKTAQLASNPWDYISKLNAVIQDV